MRTSSSAIHMRGSSALASILSVCLILAAYGASAVVRAQQTNPVDREVTNPITDEPNVNPLTQQQPIRQRLPVRNPEAARQSTEELEVRSDKQTGSGPKEARVAVYEGNVDVRIGVYRLQADKVTVYEASNRVVAEGNVVFDQEPGQRITGSRAEWNYATKLGFFVNSTGFTNQTQDGTILYFTADSVEKVATDKIIAINAEVTACEENVPKWSFKTARATITLNDRVRIKSPTFRVKGFPVLYLPYASISIKRRDRASGFLTPTFSGSGKKGFRISNAYYQTLGRSADITFRNDVYTQRGLGFGFDLRTRANSRSYFDMGLYGVKDRLFGPKEGPDNPDQGGTSFYIDGVHYFPNGFVAAADVNITSSLAYRQVFSDTIQQAISPEERSQVFLNKNSGDYSFNFLARTQVTSLPTVRIRTRQLPSITLDKRPSALKYFERLPVYFSFEGGLEGVSRKETVEDGGAFQLQVGPDGLPINTPSIVQRLDVHPRFSVPFHFMGWSVTAMAGLRGTFYSNSIDPATRLVLSRDVIRGYGEFEVDVRPPALARNYRHGDGTFFFRHVIEPYMIYRKIEGITNFERIIRTDYQDAIADTNEIEFGITNRFFTRRSTENVSGLPSTKRELPYVPLANQPYEALTITLRGKYFFDPYFGGALVPGQRNQFYPINTFSGYSYGGVPRRFSPLNIEARYRPRHNLFADLRTDLNVQHLGLRNISLTFGLNTRLIQAFQSFYFTRAVSLVPSLRQFAPVTGIEPGTQRGSQWSPSVFLGDPARGLFGGASFFFDFQNRPREGSSSLVSAVLTLGYTWDCCAVTVQNYHFNVGLRNENRTVFSFRLNGIGTFGTEQIGQHF